MNIGNFLSLLRLYIILAILTGIIYPVVIFIAGVIIAPKQAAGGLVTVGGRVVGLELIGQNFTNEQYFHSRISRSNYDPSLESGGVSSRDGQSKEELLSYGASGLESFISLESALAQVARIAKIRKTTQQKINLIVQRNAKKKLLGLYGNKIVNVLTLNIDLDKNLNE